MFEVGWYDDLPTALVVDLFVLTLCTVLLLRYGRLAHSHPAIIYLFFHVLVIPSRLLAIMAGAATLFTGWGGLFEPVTEGELIRAAFLADIVLVIVTVACIRASWVDIKLSAGKSQQVAEETATLSLRHIWSVVTIAFPIGVIAVAFVGNVPGFGKPDIDFGEWQESTGVHHGSDRRGHAALLPDEDNRPNGTGRRNRQRNIRIFDRDTPRRSRRAERRPNAAGSVGFVSDVD